LSIGNTGNAILSVTAISISGTDFNFPSPPSVPVTVPPGGIVTYTVRFAPTSIGLKSGSVTINSSDPITPSKVVSLSGTGVAPQISVSVPTLDFGSVNVLAFGDRSLSVGNDGNQVLTVSGMSFSGTDAASFGFAGTPPSFPQVVPPGGI